MQGPSPIVPPSGPQHLHRPHRPRCLTQVAEQQPIPQPIPASQEPSVAAWMISKEMTGLNLSVNRAHVSKEEMGWTQHKHSEKHLVLLRARQATVAFTPHPHHTARRAPQSSSPHGEILAPGEGWGCLPEVPRRAAAAPGSRNLFSSPFENLPRHLQTLVGPLPTSPWPDDQWQLGS